MTLLTAFQEQIESTRLIIEDDLKGDDSSIYPVVWNGVIFRPNGNFYSSGKEMKVGDKLLIAYIIQEFDTPTPILIEESEIPSYEGKFQVIRVLDKIPVLFA